jgi:endonuclease/exonuclease/phosphatase (EEP) superfamily protein YafD
MLGIDHVLVHNCVATSARTVVVRESDHRGLLVTVDVPLDPTAS